MTDNELLTALSDMLGTKLKSELQPLRNDFQTEMQAMRDTLHAEIQWVRYELSTEIQEVRNELHAEVQTLRTEIQEVRNELHAEIQEVRNELHAEIQEVRCELHLEIREVKNELQDVKAKLHLLQLEQETKVIPRLNTIESCYLDTFRRYQNNADKMDATFEDVDLLKKVVMNHSERLQKLA